MITKGTRVKVLEQDGTPEEKNEVDYLKDRVGKIGVCQGEVPFFKGQYIVEFSDAVPLVVSQDRLEEVQTDEH